MRSRLSGEVGLALLLILAALAADLLWLRPQQAELKELNARKQAAEESLTRSVTGKAVEEALLGYASGADADTTGWREAYKDRNPLRILEALREKAGLTSLDISHEGRTDVPPFEKTTYFMAVYGSFTRQIRFLKSLEQATPLILVEAFTMDTREADPRVSLRLTVSVMTLMEDVVQ